MSPFPILPRRGAQSVPTGGNPNLRFFNPTGLDGNTGPDFSNRRSAGPVIPALGIAKDVRRFGVATTNRGEWKR